MQFSLKFKLLVILTGVVAISATVFHTGEGEFKNLQVLPKNISQKDLHEIMADDFEDGLGVACNFCHAEDKDAHRVDYASDAKPEKQIARYMMRMTLNINKDYFQKKNPVMGDSLIINCTTCHRGQPHPDNF